MIKTDGIILDVDGTIWNTTPIVADAWNKAIEETFPEVARVTDKILQGQFGKTMDVIADNLFGNLSSDERKILLDKCCQYEQKAVADNKTDITYKGVVDTIKALSKKVKIFIVSNCHAGYIELVIEKLGLDGYITDFECFGNNGLTKDKNISLLCSRNGLKKPVYVGDTAGDASACEAAVCGGGDGAKDKAEAQCGGGAKSKGGAVPFVWAAYGFGTVEESRYIARINSFDELKNIIS